MEMPLGQHLRELPGPLLLTGHTGFKGAWMTFLLEHLNVPVVGYSLLAEKDSLFDRAKRVGAIPEEFSDIRDCGALEKFIDRHKPSTIIHMAAQPLVLKSYESPRETFEVNVMGTVNVLDLAFKKDFVKAVIVVTTDKVYRNNNSGRAFVETDPLEGKDPYSASKVGTEAVVAAWQQIVRVSGGPKVVSVRAGNVIGGGDFAENRIIPDLVRGAISKRTVEVRNPTSTRPWQHVLDPLVGYLKLAEKLLAGHNITSANFGPNAESISVSEVVKISQKHFPSIKILIPSDQKREIESTRLDLNSDYSVRSLDWSTGWNQENSIHKTFIWWKNYLHLDKSPEELCSIDICERLQLSDVKNDGK
jgi:CDP-glucose 4,6-dehydratase